MDGVGVQEWVFNDLMLRHQIQLSEKARTR